MSNDRDPKSELAVLLQRELVDRTSDKSTASVGLNNALEWILVTELAAAAPDFWAEFSAPNWIDGLWIIEASVPADGTVQAAGLVVWAKQQQMNLAPFEFDARLASDQNKRACYEFRFGVRGDGTRLVEIPYTSESIVRSRMFMYRPRNRRDWAFVLAG